MKSIQSLLMVEDDEGLAELFSHALSSTGLPFHIARTGAEALALFAKNTKSLLLLDYSLPDMTAATLIETLSRAGSAPPFVIITGHGDERSAVNLMKMGARDYLIKDTRLLDRLPVVINRVLKEIQVEHQLADSETTLLQNKRELEAIYEHSPSVMLLIDKEMRLRKANAVGVETLPGLKLGIAGLTPGEAFCCKHCFAKPGTCGSYSVCNSCAFRNLVLDTMETGQIHRRVEITVNSTIDGKNSEHAFLIDTVRIEIESDHFVLVCLEDIALRKQSELSIRESKRRLSALLANLPGVAYRSRNDGRCSMEFISEGCLALTGYPPSQFLNNPSFSFNDLIMEEDRPEVLVKSKAAILEHRQYEMTYRIKCAAGDIKWVWERGSGVYSDNGEAEALEGFMHDVTAQRMLENKLRQAQKMEAIGQLAGGVAHDFNNILAANMLQLGMLLTDRDLTPSMRSSLKELETGLKKAAGLTRQLLVFSRQQVVQIRTLNLCEVVTGLTKMLRRVLGEDIELVAVTPARPMFIEADAGMMEQVLMNLCVNSRDAMPKGGLLRIELEQVEIGATAAKNDPQSRPGQFVCIKVKDTGCGISEENLPHIFEPFFTTKETGKGTGLGLATVYGIISEHKGWVSVESAVGHGTTVRVFMPTSVRSPSVHAAEKTEPIRGGAETILLVEDDAIVRSMIRQCLQSYGYRVLESVNAKEALRTWPSVCDKVDLLLTDLVMPEGMTGLDLTSKLRETKPNLKVIIASGYSASLISDDILKATGARYLPKPFTATILASVVRESLADSRAH